MVRGTADSIVAATAVVTAPKRCRSGEQRAEIFCDISLCSAGRGSDDGPQRQHYVFSHRRGQGVPFASFDVFVFWSCFSDDLCLTSRSFLVPFCSAVLSGDRASVARRSTASRRRSRERSSTVVASGAVVGSAV